MVERMMQVPASLLREAVDILRERNAIRLSLDLLALLSQPTPTAEPCERCGGTGYQGDGPFSMGVPCPACTAEPPRIEDLAPEHSYEAMRTDIISALAADGFSYLESEQLLRRFESTIRDVTPPAVS